jgi:hypothetical protein
MPEKATRKSNSIKEKERRNRTETNNIVILTSEKNIAIIP